MQVISPVGLVDGGVGPRVKIDDFGPAPLPSLLFVVIALDGPEERRAGGGEGYFVPQCRRGPLSWPGSRGTHHTHAACQSNPEQGCRNIFTVTQTPARSSNLSNPF